MRKKIILWIALILVSELLFVQSLDQLSESIARKVIDFFNDKDNVKFSIIEFENYSGYSDLMAQRFYQLLVSRLESENKIRFKDLMINFNRKQGNFNLKNTTDLNYLIYLKLVRNREKVGAGVVIFSRTLDKIVEILYRETLLEKGEKEILNTLSFGFQSAGFSKVVEIDADRQLLDIKTIPDQNGESRYLFYYPEKIIAYRMLSNQLEKISLISLDWGRPFYPVLEADGRLCVFTLKGQFFLSAGNNFSSHTKIFRYQDDGWKEVFRIHFVPFRLVEINERFFLAGGEYDDGRNFFQPKLVLLPFDGDNFEPKEYFEKRIPAFFGLDFVLSENQLISVHLIDKDYRYRFYAADLEEMNTETEKKGASICSLSPEWVAVSDFSRDADRLFFYKVTDGGKMLAYQNHVKGEIIFISDGCWKTVPGFWVYIRKKQKYGEDYVLQFWAKNQEIKTAREPNEQEKNQ
jgi:hypothetical protein